MNNKTSYGFRNPDEPKQPIENLIDSVCYRLEEPNGDVTHTGILKIAGINLRCYILKNGTRLIDKEDLDKFMAEVKNTTA